MTESASGQVDLPVPPTTDGGATSEGSDAIVPAGPPEVDSDLDGDPVADTGGRVPVDPDAEQAGAGEDDIATPPPPAASPAEPPPPVPAASPAAPPAASPAEPPPPVPAPAPVMGDYRMALIAAVNVDLPNQHPTVVLRESESPRRQLSFSIGFQDAVVLTHAMRRIPTPRPLTHELMSQVLQGFDIDVVAVRLVGRQGAIYFAELDLRGRTGRSVYSCRPSDGLTVALLQPVTVPILIDRRLFEVSGDVAPPVPGAPATG
jgi:bifunctional DNase/RNase